MTIADDALKPIVEWTQHGAAINFNYDFNDIREVQRYLRIVALVKKRYRQAQVLPKQPSTEMGISSYDTNKLRI